MEGKSRRYRIGLNNESFRIDRFLTTGNNADGSGLSTKSCLYLASQGFYRGARLVDEAHTVWLPVEDVKLSPHRPKSRRDGSIALVGSHDLRTHFASGQIAYLYDFGPGAVMQLNRLTVKGLKNFARNVGVSVPERRQTKEEVIDFLMLKFPSRATVHSSQRQL